MATSWQFFAGYSTRRNSSFFTARLSMSFTKPFRMSLLVALNDHHPATRRAPHWRRTACALSAGPAKAAASLKSISSATEGPRQLQARGRLPPQPRTYQPKERASCHSYELLVGRRSSIDFSSAERVFHVPRIGLTQRRIRVLQYLQQETHIDVNLTHCDRGSGSVGRRLGI